jgi:hypothetical protein
MAQPFIRLDPRRPAVAALLADARALSVWEMLRRFGRAATAVELAAAYALSATVVQDAVDRAVEVGLAERIRARASGRERRPRFRATGEQILSRSTPRRPPTRACCARTSRATWPTAVRASTNRWPTRRAASTASA